MSGRAQGLADGLVMWTRLTWTWTFYDFPSGYIAAALHSGPSSRRSSLCPGLAERRSEPGHREEIKPGSN